MGTLKLILISAAMLAVVIVGLSLKLIFGKTATNPAKATMWLRCGCVEVVASTLRYRRTAISCSLVFGLSGFIKYILLHVQLLGFMVLFTSRSSQYTNFYCRINGSVYFGLLFNALIYSLLMCII